MVLARVRPSFYISGLPGRGTRDPQELTFDRRYELASRFTFYYIAEAVAGGLSGLLAGLITQYLDGARGIAGWGWLFIIDGVGSCFVGRILWFFMADYPSNTRWLTPQEQLLAAQHLAYDGIAMAELLSWLRFGWS